MSALLPRRVRCLCAVTLVAGLLVGVPAAMANDRPYQSLRTAVAEDDDGTWSFETWGQRQGAVRAWTSEAEYVFSPTTNLQLELSRRLDRAGQDTGHEVELEFKHLFNRLDRDGWGWGLSAAVARERSVGDGARSTLTLKLPASLALGESGALLHASLGLLKTADERRQWTVAAGAETPLSVLFGGGRRSTLFAELAREGRDRLGQVGVRHWLRKERWAIDAALQQHRSGGERASGVIIGMGWYDF